MKNVILAPGFNGASKIFKYFERELSAKGYNVIILESPLREEITWQGYEDAFDKIKEKLKDSIVIAHSIGCAMTVRYIGQNPEIAPSAFISLAGFPEAFKTEGRPDLDKAVSETTIKSDELKNFIENVPQRYSLFSDNDHVVPYELLIAFPYILQAKAIQVPGAGHMGSKSGLEEFPEVLQIIESL
jgi:predicted alpha/beta hydrolase family esterase